MEISLDGKVVLVTGGSRGIGESIVRTLCESGAQVLLHYGRGRAESETIAGELGRERCLAIQADLADADAAGKLWQDALAWRERVDVLVNNAGLVQRMTIEEDDATWGRVWHETLQINLVSLADLCRSAIRHFRERDGGIIINIASRAAFRGDAPDLMHYAASKGGVVALTRSIAQGYAQDGVLAYVVAPGFVRVERQDDIIRERGMDAMVRDIPLGEMAAPKDVANIVTFLATGLARHATGCTIDINGASYFH